MSGIIILFVLGTWGVISYFFVKLALWRVKDSDIKIFTNIFLSALIFIVPVTDDIIGGFQFRALCKENAVLKINEDNAKGKSVFLEGQNFELHQFIVPIDNYHLNYRDVETNEVILSWNEYRAQGGWLSRLINFPQGSPPYTFNGVCYPENVFGRKNIFDRLNIKQVGK